MVLNRPAHHLACGVDQFWIDDEWLLLTRYQNNPDALASPTSSWGIASLRFAPQPAWRFELPTGLDIHCFDGSTPKVVACGSPSPTPQPSASPSPPQWPTPVGPTWSRETAFIGYGGNATSVVQTLLITADGQIRLDVAATRVSAV